MLTELQLRAAYEGLRSEAVVLAGGLTDLAQRATVYHHIYRASGGNHIFPLIAAHGALWAGGYFRAALGLGRRLSWQYIAQPALRAKRLRDLDDFANVFRDVNRRVCIDTYVNFHFTARYGDHHGAAECVPSTLFAALQRIHAARRSGRELTDEERRQVFEAHFRHEQQTVVGAALENAVDRFEWPLVKFLALKPPVAFAYLPRGRRLWFRNFADQAERIRNGLLAFDLAAQAGWRHVEDTLAAYRTLPAAFFVDADRHFVRMKGAVLAAG